ncbi:hypothetical protein GH714_038781 [Hevea brasiliensis]|uniref:CBS domain-containing protein n=1 Tax=Hevea brasiliensis TaxID=3981 RepID=A0A6A6KYN0_HEVBR|nr:hypothetical protein GH714_038781 [Hevea brasiliensis]
MRAALLNAVPIFVASNSIEEDSKQLINGKGRKLIGTFSAKDLRGCHLAALQTWLPLSALEFTEVVSTSPINNVNVLERELVVCHLESPLAEVMDKAVTKHVHRVWVVDGQGFLGGLVSLFLEDLFLLRTPSE